MRVSGAAAVLIHDPIPRPGQGSRGRQSQLGCCNGRAKRLAPSSCLVVLVWSCLAWSSKVVFVVRVYQRSTETGVTDHRLGQSCCLMRPR